MLRGGIWRNLGIPENLSSSLLIATSNLPMDVGDITSEATLTYTRHDGWMVGRYVRMRR